jgi:predicted site-specific integrase-resolvase
MATPYYTTREIEERLGVTGCTLHRWRARGVGPSWNMRGDRIHYPVADFESYRKLLGAAFDNLSSEYAKRELFRSVHSSRKPLGRPRKDKATRVAKLSEYEARLDAMEERLLTLERALLRQRRNS